MRKRAEPDVSYWQVMCLAYSMNFEWTATKASKRFLVRQPSFYFAFEHLRRLAESVFEVEPGSEPLDRLIAFKIGKTCFTDFLEIAFLSVNGLDYGALKLLRGLYERAVALAYMQKNPEKYTRFFHFAAIQEGRLIEAAIALVGQKAFDEATRGTTNTRDQIQLRKEQFADEFRMPECKRCFKAQRCTHTRLASSWDEKGVPDQARELGSPYTDLFLLGYAIPILHVHVTLTSALFGYSDDPSFSSSGLNDYTSALKTSGALLLLVLRIQMDLFGIEAQEELEACERYWDATWKAPPTQTISVSDRGNPQGAEADEGPVEGPATLLRDLLNTDIELGFKIIESARTAPPLLRSSSLATIRRIVGTIRSYLEDGDSLEDLRPLTSRVMELETEATAALVDVTEKPPNKVEEP